MAESKKFKYYVVDFEDGPTFVPGAWLTDDLALCAWPPWGKNVDQLAYDKRVKKLPSPEENWSECAVKRIRAKGGELYILWDSLFMSVFRIGAAFYKLAGLGKVKILVTLPHMRAICF